MFSNVTVARVPGFAGDRRSITADTDQPYYKVEIKCFVANPPPPGLRSCPQCGSIARGRYFSGQSFILDLDNMVRNADGSIELVLIDSTARHEISIPFGLDNGPTRGMGPTPAPVPSPAPVAV